MTAPNCQKRQEASFPMAELMLNQKLLPKLFYVLQKVYRIEKGIIRKFIYALFHDISCTEYECVLSAIDIYASVSLDFVDCLLIAYHQINQETIFSFDKKLNKHLDMTIYPEPGNNDLI